MKHNFNGKILNIPDKEIQHFMKSYEISQDEAIQLWLEDEGYLDNEEAEELTKKAQENRVTATIHNAKGDKKKTTKVKVVKVSDEKATLFKEIFENVSENHENVEILKENKLIQVKIGEKTFKIDLIEQRQPKK